MPCPFFYPIERFDAGITVRFPLIDPYRGECHSSAESQTPDDATLLACCNMGYARGRCDRFHSCDGPDAVRFAIGPGDVIRYAREQDHFPFDAGELSLPGDGILAHQAKAFLNSYQRRIKHG